MEKCYSLLNPNGKLIIRIPDFSGIEVRIYKKFAYTLHLPYHLYHFTPQTIKNYLMWINFKKVKITHESTDRDLIAPLSYIIRDNENAFFFKYLLKIFTLKWIRKTLIHIFVKILSFLGKTSRMTIIVRK